MKWSDEDEKQPGQIEADGIYPFEVVEAEEKVSQKGNPYINIKMVLYVEDAERTQYDILIPQMPVKLRSFCEATGLEEKYKNKTLSADDCMHRQGYVRMGKKPDDKGYYKPDSYLAKMPPQAAGDDMGQRVGVINPGTGSVERTEESDDSIPF